MYLTLSKDEPVVKEPMAQWSIKPKKIVDTDGRTWYAVQQYDKRGATHFEWYNHKHDSIYAMLAQILELAHDLWRRERGDLAWNMADEMLGDGRMTHDGDSE